MAMTSKSHNALRSIFLLKMNLETNTLWFSSGKTKPSVKPVWERERLVGTITTQPLQYPMGSACVAVSPFLPTTDFSHECSKVDSESTARLKMSLMEESGNEECMTKKKGFTTFETLAAYIWRSRARALKLSYDGETNHQTMLNIVVGVRPHLLDPLPRGYYGNTIVEAYVMLTVREPNVRALLEVVKLIRKSKKVAINSNYIRHPIDSMETPKSVKYNYESGAITILMDWRHLGLLENVDFGWKELVNTMPSPRDIYGSMGLCTILPPSNLDPSTSGGARVYVSLPSSAMPKFKEEMKALTSIKKSS
ncbi:Spermidine coumaroyl-CoA acyltransferase [Glycine soja]|uniref:Spermidine coumaroyl-CoA acyltransferase n=1 Tax=Glycine soja TaxID=3848 RepID=A0A445KMP7_GLYSO|nr:Spermidine coumaroyl-CoA acyltransferase [Glycine soja]